MFQRFKSKFVYEFLFSSSSSPGGDEKIYSNFDFDFDLPNSNEVLDRITSPLATWMSSLAGTAAQDIPLYNLLIPGSHDSGAYRLSPASGFAVDRPDLQRSWLLNTFRVITYPLVARFSRTQRLPIYAQLRVAGIRYLDLRIAYRSERDDFYICHNFYGPPLAEILSQIVRFVEAADHRHEILILDFQHFHGFGEVALHSRLLSMIIEKIGARRIIEPGDIRALIQDGEEGTNFLTDAITLRRLWAASETKRVFVIYRNSIVCNDISRAVWPAESLPNPWPNTRDARGLRRFLLDQIGRRPARRMFVTQGVMTPNTGYVVRNFFGSLESRLSIAANQAIRDLLRQKWRPKFLAQILAPTRHDDEDDGLASPLGPNIVMFDFVEWRRCELTREIVQCNRRDVL